MSRIERSNENYENCKILQAVSPIVLSTPPLLKSYVTGSQNLIYYLHILNQN